MQNRCGVMRILYIVDARSPFARNWMQYFVDRGDEVHVVSTVDTQPFTEGLATFQVLPIALGKLVGSAAHRPNQERISAWTRVKRSVATQLSPYRSLLSAYDVYRHAGRLGGMIREIRPDLVHAMRFPFEVVLAAAALGDRHQPLVASVWGNDFTLHATRSRKVAHMYRRAMARVDALHPDCERDLRIAGYFGWTGQKHSFVLPGGGGVQRPIFRPGDRDKLLMRELGLSTEHIVAINPRGIRPYVPTESVFRAVARISSIQPRFVLLAAATAEEPLARHWVRKLHIEDHVRLLPSVDRLAMARYMRLANIVLSPSTHDGTPNSLIESIACGCFPVVGDVVAVREWIVDGANGLVCDATSVESIVNAVLTAISDRDLQESALKINQSMVDERADYEVVMHKAALMYSTVLGELVDGASHILKSVWDDSRSSTKSHAA